VVLSGFDEFKQVGIDLVRIGFVLIRLVPSFFGCQPATPECPQARFRQRFSDPSSFQLRRLMET
jgi:hypothetical protein